MVLVLIFGIFQTERGVAYKERLIASLDRTQRELPMLKGYETKENEIEMTLGEDIFTFKKEERDINILSLYEGEDKIETHYNDDFYYFKDPRLKDITLKYGRISQKNTNESFVEISYGDLKYKFTLLNKGIYYLYQNKVLGTMSTASHIESWSGYGRLGSGRIFIWSRSIPMILDNYIFVGAGADVYPLVYPQDDYIAKRYDFGNENIIVDKPHNLYILYATNAGLLFLFLFLGINSYLVFRLIVGKTENEWYRLLNNSVVLGIIAYLIVGMINDSTVGTAPVYWIIIGMGMAIIKWEEENRKPKFMKK